MAQSLKLQPFVFSVSILFTRFLFIIAWILIGGSNKKWSMM
jgi:hypothetical protein